MMESERRPDFPKPGEAGCLFIHGYRGSPSDLEGLAGIFADAGFRSRVVTLPGHGDDFADFGKYGFADWLGRAEQELVSLLEECPRVAVVGFSMVGTLALNLAARYPVAAVASLSAPAYVLNVMPWPVTNARFYGAAGLLRLRRMFSFLRFTPKDEDAPREIARWRGYSGPIRIPQLLGFRAGCAATRALLPRLSAPLLVMQDAGDRIVYQGNAFEIMRLAGAPRSELVFTRIAETVTSRHLIPTHRETAGYVADRVLSFCREHCG